ncbi:HTH_XRE domain containing protein [uncultured Caudovirales phage]|uniref:HTH_XRE domain containing protein n=1 Tax=uncultured Caudovirales phage TaxID=2100421 RepID=A0A6J5N146_9CAUD|nr:HTH_XRE domain containing protein [uncultured Caudovirales phage]
MGSAIKTERERQNLTLRDVAKLSYTSLGYLSEVERGLKQPSFDVLEPLCDALNYPLSKLLQVVGTSLEEVGK